MLTGVSIIDVYSISECPSPYFRPLCSQRQISHIRPRSQGLRVLSQRQPQRRHLGDGPRLSLRFQPVSGSLHFDCAQQKKAHMFIHIHLTYCCLSLSLGSGRVVRRRKVPSWKEQGREHTSPLSWEKVAALPLVNARGFLSVHLAREGDAAAPAGKAGPMLPFAASRVLISRNHTKPAGSLYYFLISQMYVFRIQANAYIIIIKLFTV